MVKPVRPVPPGLAPIEPTDASLHPLPAPIAPLPRSQSVSVAVSDAERALQRQRSAEIARPVQAQRRSFAKRAKRVAIAYFTGLLALVIGAAVVSGLLGGIGIIGFTLMMLLAILLVPIALSFGKERAMRPADLSRVDVAQLADRTNVWLGQQRRALPAPAQTLVDSIGERIAQLGPQLEAIGGASPEAVETRRIVGDELPELIRSYQSVPSAMRREDRNGRVAERDLLDGLANVDRAIDTLSRDIAARDMDRLASHSRYLETRYGDGGQSIP